MAKIVLSLLAGAQLFLLSLIVWLKDSGLIQSNGAELDGQRVILLFSASLLLCSGAASFRFRRTHRVSGWVSFGLGLVTMFGLLASLPAIALAPNKLGFLAPFLWGIAAIVVTILADVGAGALAAHRKRAG